MKTKNFAAGFFGRMPFGMDGRKDFFGKWSEMTDQEKVEFMNKRMEAMSHDVHGECGHSGHREFSVASIDQRCEEWMKKTLEEKEAFVTERKEAMHEHFGEGFFKKRKEHMNEMREKWAKMSDQEKQEFIRKKEEAMKNGTFEGR